MPKSAEAFEEEIYNLVGELTQEQEKSFFRKLIEGQLTEDGLKGYYRHLYHECTHFVRLVSLVHSFAEERDQRETIAANFCEEYCNGQPGKNHPAMAMHVGVSLGLTEQEIEEHGLLPEVKEAFEDVRQLAFGSFLEGLAVLTTIEFDLPLRHKIMRQALQNHYGLKDEDLEYYHEHMEDGGVRDENMEGYGGDDVHVGRQVKVLTKYADTDEKQDAVRDAIKSTFVMRNTLIKALDAKCGAVQ